MVEETKVGVIEKLYEKPWSPISPVGVKMLDRVFRELCRLESMVVRHFSFKLHLLSQNSRVLGL